ncbi:MAG: hypothetical protein JW951_07215 [Lentisphaerae bacterium]|nr:hypothetical protein [Lentisphaerota bacterium]
MSALEETLHLLSLESRGAERKVFISLVLTLILPSLAFGFIGLISMLRNTAFPPALLLLIGALALIVAAGGFLLLRQTYRTGTARLRATIARQAEHILAAERQRVMLQSIGAACHHVGQPATVLRAHLQHLRRHADHDERERLEACATAADTLAEVLQRLREVTEYRTVPDVAYTQADGRPDATHIIDIG